MDDKKKLYDGLLGLGFTESELGTFDTFSANLDNPEKNKVFYDALIGSKRVNVEQLGTYDTFSAKTLKKKEDTGVGSSEPIKTAQQSLLDAEKHPATPKADVDRAVDERIETNWKLNNIKLWEKALKTPIGQERWSGDDRLKVREYNNTLSDISATTQEKDVQHYFNVLKSPEMKLLQGTDKVEENLSEALKNKYKRLQALHKYLQDKRIIIGDEYRPIESDPLKKWDDYNIPDWDKKLNIAAGRWLNHAIGGNLLTKIAEAQQTPEQQSKDVQESIDIEAKYQPSMLEDLSAKAFSFLADAPVFAVLGEAAGVGGRMVVKSALNSVTRELMAQGVTREAAQGIALKGMSKMTQLGVEALSNGVTQGITLGVYNTINSTLGQYEEAYANGEDVEHFDWRRTLYEGGEGFLMGLSTGIVSPLFSKAESTVDAIVEHSLARNMAKLGLATTGFATEASIFAAVPASLQGRIPTKKEIVESGLMLLAIKGGALPLKLAGRVNVSKAKHDPIDYTDRELELLGIKDNPYETIKNMSKEDIEKIYTNPKIPVVTAWKVIENHAGIAPVGVAYPDVVKVEKEGDRTFLRSYTKTENGYDLLSESEYPDKTSADAAASVGIEQIFDEKIKDRIHDASTREKGLLKSSLNKLEPKEKDAMMEAFDTPVFARTSEQKRLTDKFYEITDGVLGTGKNAYESELTKHFFDEKQPESDTVAQQPKAEEIGQKTAPIEAKKEEIQNEIKPENIFDLRENLLTLQKEQYGREVKKEQGATISGEARGVDVRGESLAVDTGKKARYDVGGSAGITRDASVREISTPDAEIAEIRKTRPKFTFDTSFDEIKDADLFHKQISSSKEGNKYSASVFVYPKEVYSTSKLYLTKDGKAGAAITKDGDIISVFSYGEGKGRVPQIIINAIKEGGVSLDHYDTALTDYYYSFGFVPVAKVKWNDTYAPKDWNKDVFKKWNNGQPDVIAMAYHGGDPKTLYQRIGKFSGLKEALEKTPYVESWDEAKRLQKEYVTKVSKSYAVEKGKIQEGGQPEYKGTGGLVEEVGQTGSIPTEEQKTGGETGGSNRPIESTKSIPAKIKDVEVLSASLESLEGKEAKTKSEEVKSRLQEVINENRKTFDRIDPRYTKYLLDKVNKAKPSNVTRTVNEIKKILESGEKQNSIKQAYEARDKIRTFRSSPRWSEFVKGIDLKSGFMGKKLSIKLSGIPVENLPDGVINDYIETVNNLTSKTPDYNQVKNFINSYEAEIRKQQDLANIQTYDSDKAITRINDRITRIRDNMQKAETPEQIVALKMELGKLKGEAVKMKKLGIYEEDDGKVKVWDAKEAEIEEFLKNLPQFSEEMQGKVKALETEYKKTTTNEISERWDNIKRKEATEKGNPYLDTPEGKVVNDIYTALGKAVNDEWAIERLSMNDISEMKDALDLIDETGIAPIVVLEKENKIKGAVMASKAKGRIFDAVNANKDHVQVMRFLGMSEEDMKKKIAQRPDIHIGSLLNLTRRMEADPLFLKPIFKSLQSMIDNPIYNIVTHPGSEAINASERMIKDFLNPVYKEFGKQTQNIFERYVFDFGKNRKDVKIFDRLHILEAQLRVWDLMNNFKGRVIQTGERFYGTELNGTPYKEDGKIKYFDTADEAIKYVKAQPTDKVGDRPLDFYDLVNFDIKDGRKVPSVERKNAVIARGTKTNELEKRMFDEAYGELLDRTKAKDLSGIRSEQDVLKILTPEEKELWKLIKKVYNDSKPYMDIVAGREGLALKHEENYTPMNVRSMSDVAYDSNATMNDLYDQVQNGHRPQVTTNILRKGNQLKYIDFNGLRVLEKYVRDMSMSYHVLPAMRTQLSALGMNVEEYKDTDISNFAKALRTNIVDGYKIEYSKRSMFGNIKIATSKDVYDVSKGIRLMAQGIRNKLLNKMIRPAQDIVPNSIKTVAKGVFRVENKPAWKTFYSFNPGVAGNIERLRYGQSKIGEYEAIERKGAMQSFTNEWIGTGDDFTKGKWQYTFMDAYKKLTGQDFDVNRYVYDWEYRDKINGQDEFEQSKAIADGFIEENLVPLNKYSNRKAVNMLGWRMSTGERMYDFLNAMSSYTAQENMGAIAYLNDIRFNLYSKEADAVKVRRAAMIKLGQVIISNMAYNLMTQAAFNATAYGAGAVFKDERVKESAIENLKGMFSAKNTMANGILSAVNLMFGGYMNVGRTMLSLTYNGYKGMSKLDMNKREAYEFDTNIRFLDQKLGLNRYIDPTLDLSKSSIPWETAVNTLFPVIGSNMTQMALDVKTLATQPYNYVQGKMAEDKYDANEFKGFELLKAVNSLFMAYTIPVSADINNMSRAMLSQQSRKVPEEVKDADILLHNFTLTNDEVRQMYEDKYKDVYDRAKKAGDENPMETALEAADRVEKTYLMDKDDNDYYSFYWNNKKNIDILGDVLMDVVNDKSMKISERKEWFKKINANATDLQEQFNGYQKGEDNMFMVDDEILARWIEKGLDQRWESTNKNIKQNMIKIQSQYGR